MKDGNDQSFLVAHPDEIVATVFLPLPEALGVPLGTIVRSVQQFYTNSVLLEDSKDKLGEVPLAEITGDGLLWNEAQEDHGPGATEGQVSDAVPVFRWAVLRDSLIFHQAWSNLLARTGLDAAFAISQSASGFTQIDIEELGQQAEDFRVELSHKALVENEETRGPVSVVECAVPIKVLASAALPEVELEVPHLSEIQQPASPDSCDLNSSDMTMWEWHILDESTDQVDDTILRRCQYALDMVIDDIQRVQRAHFVVRRQPITLLTRERLPFLVPIILRRAGDIHAGEVTSFPSGILHANTNYWSAAPPADLDDVQLDTLFKARSKLETSAFSSFLDLYRESSAALVRQGDTRAAAIFSAVSSESLLDELLLHMYWEERKTPEGAANEWKDAIVKRVKAYYSSRLGGIWDAKSPGVVTDWIKATVHLRNRVVHSGYTPTYSESEDSLKAVLQLQRYLGDRLAIEPAITHYTRTAAVLVGEEGLTRRGVTHPRVQQLRNDKTEPLWSDTFLRWRECWRRVRRDMISEPREPAESEATLFSVIDSSGSVTWCIQHEATAMARSVDVDIESLEPHILEFLDQCIERARDPSTDERLVISIANSVEYNLPSNSKWIEEYHLMPLRGVMIDRSDHDAPVPD